MSNTTRPTRVSSRLALVMAVACGVGVANAYFPQAITPLLAADLGISAGSATLIATVAQIGYALGIFLLVPLGDRLPRRPLIAGLFGIVAVGLLVAGATSSLVVLCLAGAVVGAATVVPQILIPMAADLAPEGKAGGMVATLQAGLLGGILLARAFGGVLGEWLGWRGPYFVAAALAVLLAVVLVVGLPDLRSSADNSYPSLLRTTLRLFADQPDLRRSCAYQFLIFGAFTAAWTSLALLVTGPGYGFGTSVVGIIALVGAASILAVKAAGRMTDRRGPDVVNAACIVGLIVSAVILLTGLLGGWFGLVGLVVGMLLLDVSVQSSQVANQARIFALVPDARARLNSAYMTCVFAGGSLGSWAGARLFVAFGWTGVCALVAAAALLALVRHTTRRSSTPVVSGAA